MKTGKGAGRLTELDALRGLAALSVVLYHFIYRYPIPAGPPRELIARIFGIFPIQEFYLGQLPVYLFFMISGFVIFFTASQCATAGQFCYRRFSRLYPVYWGAIIVMTLAIILFGGPYTIDPRKFFFNLTMLQGHLKISHMAFAFWSLTVELSFYFLVALAIRFGLMPYRKTILLIWSAGIFLYGFYDTPNPVPWPVVYLLVLDYGHFFVFGIAVYELWRAKNDGADAPDPFLLGLILISFASSIIRYPGIVAVLVLAIHILFYLAVMGRLGFLRNRALVFLGGISYALYLEHEVIGIIAMEQLALPRILEIGVALVIVLGVAVILNRAIEQPSITWLRKHQPAWAK